MEWGTVFRGTMSTSSFFFLSTFHIIVLYKDFFSFIVILWGKKVCYVISDFYDEAS